MKSSTEKAIFGIIYALMASFGIIGAWNPENPLLSLLRIFLGLIVWYPILKGIFWIIRQLCRYVLRFYSHTLPEFHKYYGNSHSTGCENSEKHSEMRTNY